MRASVLTIGDELLSGNTVNTNASWISQNLTLAGCNVIRHFTVCDEEQEIKDSLTLLFELPIDLIVCTGGLGPTDDDITRKSIFNYFNSDSEFDEDYWANLQRRFSLIGHEISESNKSQAIIPSNGKVFPNSIGSARGLSFKKDNITLMALPGVPSEMESMMKETVLPWVRKNSKQTIFSINIRTTGVPESMLFENISVNNDNIDSNVKIGYYPSLFGVDIRISGDDKISIEKVKKIVIDNVGSHIYSIGEDSLEEIVVNKLLKNNLTISTIESCTGGLIGHRITQVPGSSSVYSGGIISYSNEAKLNQVKVNSNILKNHGAVSEEVALEMAKNGRNIFNSDICVSVTGIAGPGGGTKDKPVGLVYVGYCTSSILKVDKYSFHSNRKSNKLRTSQAVLNLIMKNIE